MNRLFSNKNLTQPRKFISFKLLVTSLIVLVICVKAFSQIIYNPNDERFRQLALEKAIWTFQEQKVNYARSLKLKEKGLIADVEFRNSQRTYKIAEVELEQALLALSQEAPHLVIESAISSHDSSGRRTIDIKLRNLSQVPSSENLKMLLNDVSNNISMNNLLVLRNIFVSLKDNGVIVALPYEQKIDSLIPGETVTLHYQLLRELDEIEIASQFSGKVETKKLLIQKATGSSLLQISSSPVAQEASYGSTVTYKLFYNRGMSESSRFDISIKNLPLQYQAKFIDLVTNARVSKLIFSPASESTELLLEINLPSRITSNIDEDSLIHFYVIAIPENDPSIKSQIELELVPVGRGEILLNTRNWLQRGTINNPPIIEIEVKNIGSIELNDVRWDFIGPSSWEINPDAESINLLKSDETKIISISLKIPQNEIPGEYEIGIRTYSIINGQRIESDQKSIRVILESESSFIKIISYIAIFIILIYFAIWVSKKLYKR